VAARKKTPRKKAAPAKAVRVSESDILTAGPEIEPEPEGEDVVFTGQRASASKPRKVGPYRVQRQIGRGGMAVVYRGLHEGLQREVAIKELLAHQRDQEAASRFRREALALAGFRHQNIVTLYDLIDKNGTPYMVLELVNGPTLSELLKEGPLPPEVAAVICARLASALEHAHLARITHRDIKPSNVMLTREGEVKLMDFGIAKDDELAGLTREGLAIGTPAYMSPEQVSAAPLDHRTDIYSLGVLLYECLCGKRAFNGKSVQEMFINIRAGTFRPLRKQNPSVPWALVSVVKRAMRVNVEDRYFDAAELRRDLELFLGKRVAVSHSALLIAYLFQKGRISETEVMERITQREMHALDSIAAAPRRSRRLAWATAIGVGAAAALAATNHLWWPLVRSLGH
jgi:eukaryotic-like serine/threonine-protein kinase